jgi:hypothetical protein
MTDKWGRRLFTTGAVVLLLLTARGASLDA